MFLVLWEFEVKPDREKRFQEVYGPGGDWDSLFRTDPNHVGTRLFRDTNRSGVYLTADSWLSRKSYEEFLALRRSEYDTLDAAAEDLTLSERRIGLFETDAPRSIACPQSNQTIRAKIGPDKLMRTAFFAQHSFRRQISAAHCAFHGSGPAGVRPIAR